MNKQCIIIGIIGLIIGSGVGYYGGTKFASSKTTTPGAYSQGSGRNASGTNGTGSARVAGDVFVTGQITAKDTTNLTITMPDGSSKIALCSSSTIVKKSTPGSLDDITTGTQVRITGKANPDGSITAKNILIGGSTQGGGQPQG